MVARLLSMLIVAGALVGDVGAVSDELGNRPPVPAPKSAVPAIQPRVVMRQGGDTMATATPIEDLPYVGSGTTVGFANDYDIACPTAGSTSPDVVYSFTRPQYGTLTIDLCGSDYDTKIYVMSEAGQVFDCNDDYYNDSTCGQHTSRIDNLWLPPGETYYLIVDGAGGAAGHYEFEVRRWDAEETGTVGDTTLNPFVIDAIPYTVSGTTAVYVNDYDEVCPYTGSTAPDVVYKYVATSSQSVVIDLCGSSYDTKLYVYDADMNLIACNDDFYSGAPCGVYVSLLENVSFDPGMTYYIIIDGYGSAAGAYILDIALGAGPCVLTCPGAGIPEGEPPLGNGYVDNWNGGCNTSPGYPFESVWAGYNGEAILCGVAGWYLTSGGGQSRDTDWYLLFKGQGNIEVTADAEYASYIFELGPQICGSVAVIQQATAGPCAEAFMTISGYAFGAPVWFWVGSTVFVAPPGAGPMYDYVVWFSGLEVSVATESTTWSTMKALYR
jgi:hypothetical protein